MRSRGLGSFAVGAFISGAILWSLLTTEVELSRLLSAGPRIADFLGRMVPPDPTVGQVAIVDQNFVVEEVCFAEPLFEPWFATPQS